MKGRGENHTNSVQVKKLIEKEYGAQHVELKCKRSRGILTKLRGGTVGFEVETGRWWCMS